MFKQVDFNKYLSHPEGHERLKMNIVEKLKNIIHDDKLKALCRIINCVANCMLDKKTNQYEFHVPKEFLEFLEKELMTVISIRPRVINTKNDILKVVIRQKRISGAFMNIHSIKKESLLSTGALRIFD